MEISVIGLNHRTAPLRAREQYALPPDLALRLLRAVRKEGLCEEVLVLDTCNRTEIYSVAARALSMVPTAQARQHTFPSLLKAILRSETVH